METAIELNNMLAAIYQIASNEIRKELFSREVQMWNVRGFKVYNIKLSTDRNNVGSLSPNLLRSSSNGRVYNHMIDDYVWEPMKCYRIGLSNTGNIAVFNAKAVALDRAQGGERVGLF